MSFRDPLPLAPRQFKQTEMVEMLDAKVKHTELKIRDKKTLAVAGGEWR